LKWVQYHPTKQRNTKNSIYNIIYDLNFLSFIYSSATVKDDIQPNNMGFWLWFMELLEEG
jgi:hypothetical protein